MRRAWTRLTSTWMPGQRWWKPRDERQQAVHRAVVGPDEHAAALEVGQLAHGRLGLVGEAHQPLGVVLQHAAGLGQPAVLGGAVHEPLAQFVLEPAQGLAHRGLGAMEALGGLRETAFRGHREEHLQLGDVH